jgi:predicted nucleotidyltransferase
MRKKVDKLAKDLRNNLKKSFKDFEGLYVYGSQVKGNYNKDSDVDIVVIIDANNKKKRWEIWDILSKIQYDYDMIIDLQPYTRSELKRNYIFHDEVVKKGIFYAA